MTATIQRNAPAGGGARRPWLQWALALAIVAIVGLGVAQWAGWLGSAQRWLFPPHRPAHPKSEEEMARDELLALETGIKEAYSANRIQTVIPRVEALVRKYPRFASGHTALGNVYSLAARSGEAYDEFCRSLELQPLQPELRINAGTLAMQLDRYPEALAHFSKALGLDPGNARYLVFRGDVLLKLNKTNEAQLDALSALRLDSNCHEAYALLSDLDARQGPTMTAQALEQIQRAIDCVPIGERPTQATYVRKKAALLRRDARWEDALNTLRGLSPESKMKPEVVEEMALCWMGLGRPADAAENYEKALQLAGADNPTPDWRLAAGAVRWRLKADDKAKARTDLNVLKFIKPDAPEIAEFEKVLK
jgi:tetratricopeptide (TPR) repeat protein